MIAKKRQSRESCLRIAVVTGRFNSFITDRLLDGALEVLHGRGLSEDEIVSVRVPGAFEIPVVIKRLAASGHYDGVVALGCVIRGATPHFDYVAGECARGIQAVSLEFSMPVGFGILTVDTLEQAIDRAGAKQGNKGADAAVALLQTLDVVRALDG